ncbi:tyrosine-type recombinase/integrase [Flavobacterium aestivum]|uniref:tyrosine-type recombinase/integrase n=1 Tax=Flavobacterium aestivum TaxID=3003257 RepID=UPI002285FF6E|nr:site-specific integrase [Flavobacterium aestivum]
MQKINDFLKNIHKNVHGLEMKRQYSDPKIYTGGVDIKKWKTLSEAQKQAALKKNWYLYYSFRDPETNLLTRQPNIKDGVNWYKTKEERLEILEKYRISLSIVLKNGYNPYTPDDTVEEDVILTIEEAFAMGIKLKEKVLAEKPFATYKLRINHFKEWLYKKQFIGKPITAITKKAAQTYLNEIVAKTSARNYNDARGILSSLFQVLQDNDVIADNFILKIPTLKSTPKRNKTYTQTVQEQIFKDLKEKDSQLLLFILFISYNFLRPVEVCRLRVEDIDIIGKRIYIKAKNKPVKTKIIPEIMLRELPNLENKNKKHFLFTPNGIGEWVTKNEDDKRGYFTKRFNRVVKKPLGLGIEYGLYSFRHYFIGRLYQKFVQTMTPFEAKSKLMLITGHSTMSALEKYLRDIDAALPEDYSEHLKLNWPVEL